MYETDLSNVLTNLKCHFCSFSKKRECLSYCRIFTASIKIQALKMPVALGVSLIFRLKLFSTFLLLILLNKFVVICCFLLLSNCSFVCFQFTIQPVTHFDITTINKEVFNISNHAITLLIVGEDTETKSRCYVQ
jgi:hypothetical protein